VQNCLNPETLAVRSCRPQGVQFVAIEYTRLYDEVVIAPGSQGESLGFAVCDIEDQLRMFPRLVLTVVNVEGAVGNGAEEHVVAPDDELPLTEAERQTPVATATRLEEHDGPVLGY
jgi:hypothetical protein